MFNTRLWFTRGFTAPSNAIGSLKKPRQLDGKQAQKKTMSDVASTLKPQHSHTEPVFMLVHATADSEYWERREASQFAATYYEKLFWFCCASV